MTSLLSQQERISRSLEPLLTPHGENVTRSCAGYNLAESVYEDIMEMLDREADGSDSLEVSTNRLSAYTADNACRDVLRLPLLCRLAVSDAHTTSAAAAAAAVPRASRYATRLREAPALEWAATCLSA